MHATYTVSAGLPAALDLAIPFYLDLKDFGLDGVEEGLEFLELTLWTLWTFWIWPLLCWVC